METLLVDDIFESIQGETLSMGYPTTFIRLFGCNVKCSYCDQPQVGYSEMTVEDIMSKVKSYGHKRVCITGGEPLMQKNWIYLAKALDRREYLLNIETNGCVPLTICSRHWRYSMDIKTPSSGVSSYNILDNIRNLSTCDEIKFVLKDKEDLDFSREIIRNFIDLDESPKILFSPVINGYSLTEADKSWIRELTSVMLSEKIFDGVRLQVQFHKVIGVK